MKTLRSYLNESTDQELVDRGMLRFGNAYSNLKTVEFTDIDDVPTNSFAYAIRLEGLKSYRNKRDKMIDTRDYIRTYMDNWGGTFGLIPRWDRTGIRGDGITFHDGNGWTGDWGKGSVGFEITVKNIEPIQRNFDAFVQGLIRVLKDTPKSIEIITKTADDPKSSGKYYSVYWGGGW